MSNRRYNFEEDLQVFVGDDGEIADVRTKIKGTTMHIREWNALMRSMPHKQRELMEKGIKVLGVIPMFSLEGQSRKGLGNVKRAFRPDWLAMNATRDEIDWFLKRYPEFSARKKDTGKDPRIVIK